MYVACLEDIIHGVAHDLGSHLHALVLHLEVAHDLLQGRQVHLPVHGPHSLGGPPHRLAHRLSALQGLRAHSQGFRAHASDKVNIGAIY